MASDRPVNFITVVRIIGRVRLKLKLIHNIEKKKKVCSVYNIYDLITYLDLLCFAHFK